MSRTFSGIEVELLWRRMITVVDEAATALVRTSFSSIVRDFHDYACALFDAQGRMLAQSTNSTPGLLGILPYTIRNFMKHPAFATLTDGDVMVTNDPWLASGHLVDVTIASPICLGGNTVGYMLCVVHHLNMGGRLATLMSRDVFEEGLKIPIMFLYRKGEPESAVFDLIRSNVREPDKVIGDLRAQVSANMVGQAKVIQIMKSAKLDTLEDLGNQIIDRSEKSMRQAISTLPRGRYGHSMTLHNVADYERPVTLAVEIDIRADSISVNYEGTTAQIPRAVNVTLNFTRSYTVFPLRCILNPDAPSNEGSLRPIEISAPEGSILNAKYPSPTWGRTAIGHFVPDLVMRALESAVPDRLIASSGATPLWYLNFTGRRRDGRSFYNVMTFHGGMGARASSDGLPTSSYPSNVASMPVEVIESESPLLFRRKMFATDSAGAGKFRGGLGVQVEMTLLGDEIDPANPPMLSLRGGRFGEPISGICGGHAAPDAWAKIDGSEVELVTQREVGPGTTVELLVPGGGGYGDPGERSPDQVRADLESGVISTAAATADYGLSGIG